MEIAFLGLGVMGKPMAMNLVRAGYRVRSWNRSAGAVAALAAIGGVPAESPREAAEGADILFSMLADDEAARSVVIDAGAFDALKPGAIHVNMATTSVRLAEEFERLHRQKSVSYIAAPVLGRSNVAETGQLEIIVAGEAMAIERVRPLFDCLGRRTWHFGERPERANAIKLAANFMIASAIGTMGEAAALAQGYGASKAGFLDLITSTIFAAPVYKNYGGAIAEGRFEPAGFKMSLGLKDVRLALEAAEAARVPLPIASLLKDNLIDGLAHGEDDFDWAALARVAARRAAQD
ncbi:MAG: oxidoreductase [Methylocystaceae bacterium]|nr:MAG: oxidoreductase [Methylocystaceae bacterium]